MLNGAKHSSAFILKILIICVPTYSAIIRTNSAFVGVFTNKVSEKGERLRCTVVVGENTIAVNLRHNWLLDSILEEESPVQSARRSASNRKDSREAVQSIVRRGDRPDSKGGEIRAAFLQDFGEAVFADAAVRPPAV